MFHSTGEFFVHQFESLVQLLKVQSLRGLDDIDVFVEFVFQPFIVSSTQISGQVDGRAV